MQQINQWLQQGVQAHQRGDAAEAARCYQAVLAQAPKHADALHLSGVLALQRGDLRQAQKLISKAIKVNGKVADYHSNLGEALRQQGQWVSARRALQQAIKLQPGHVLSLNNLGLVAAALQQPDEARRYYQQALLRRPDYFEANFNLAQLLVRLGEDTEAIPYFEQASKARATYPPVLLGWGNALRRCERFEEALNCFDLLLKMQPEDAVAMTNRGECLLQLERLEEAALTLEQALAIDEQLATAHSILGVVRMAQEHPAAASACFERALAIDPEHTQARLNLAQVAREQRQLDEAANHYERILAAQPDCAEAYFGRAMLRLSQGEWQSGWEDYEWRLQCRFQAPLPDLQTPRWGGERSSGRLLILTEQGFGDNLMAWRFIAAAAERVGEVWLQVPAPLVALARTLPNVAGVCDPDSVPPHDMHCPLLSLPHRLAMAPEQVSIPYLTSSTAAKQRWGERLAALGDGIKVGVCWAGSALNPKNQQRQLGLLPLRPLFELPGVHWISVQKESSQADRQWLADAGVELHDWMEEVSDFADTAGLVDQLDLVISLDSAVVHLTGALGRDCWTLVPFYHDWRWQLEGKHSIWYPQMTLFRQSRFGDWTPVIEELKACLSQRLASY